MIYLDRGTSDLRYTVRLHDGQVALHDRAFRVCGVLEAVERVHGLNPEGSLT